MPDLKPWELTDEATKAVQSLAIAAGFDASMVTLYGKVRKALCAEFESVDSGLGSSVLEYHVRFGDMEYYIAVKPNRSLADKGGY